MTKSPINPSQLYDGSSVGLSHGVVASPRALLFVSGQVAWDRDGQVSTSDVGAQADAALANLKLVLEEAGASVADLLQVRVYVRGELGEHMSVLGPKLAAFLSGSQVAVTGIGVASLASPQTLIEIEAVAGLEVGSP